MTDKESTICPTCRSGRVRFHEDHMLFSCSACGHVWGRGAFRGGRGIARNVKVYLSHSPGDAGELADRLYRDLDAAGYEVLPHRKVQGRTERPRTDVERDLRSCQVVLALMSPDSVTADIEDEPGSVPPIEELRIAAGPRAGKPVVPVMVSPCEPPFRLHRYEPVNMRNWRRSRQDYKGGLARITDSVEAALVGEVRYQAWEQRLKPFDFMGYLDNKRQGFSGREWLFAELEHWLVARREPVFTLVGEPGFGKTAFAARLIHANPGGYVLAAHCCRADVPETLRPERFVHSIAAMVASRMPGFAALIEEPALKEAFARAHEDPKSVFANAFLAALEKLDPPGGRTRCIVVDGLDEALLVDKGVSIIDVLAEGVYLLPRWLRLLVTTRTDAPLPEQLTESASHEVFIGGPRNLADLVAHIGNRLKSGPLASRLARSGMQASEVVRMLSEKSEGNILYIGQALAEIESGRLPVESVDTLPPGLFGLYQEMLSRRYSDTGSYGMARKLFEVVAASREPLPQTELARACDLDVQFELIPLCRRLAPLLQEIRTDSEEPCYRLFHKTLEAWLTDELLAGPYLTSTRNGHMRLAAFCMDEWRKRHTSAYALAHGPAHLAMVGRIDELEALVTDPVFMEMKCRLKGASELLYDYRLLPTERAGRKVPLAHRTFLEKAVYELTSHPGLLCPLALARDRDDPVSRGVRRRMSAGGWPTSPYFTYNSHAGDSTDGAGELWSVQLPEMPTSMDAGLTSAQVMVGCHGGTVWVLRPHRRDLVRLESRHKSPVDCLVMLENEERACSLDREGLAVFWDLGSGREVDSHLVGREAGSHVTFVPGQGFWAFGTNEGMVHLYAPHSGEVIRSWIAHRRGLQGIGAYGYTVVTVGKDNRICFWDAGTGALVQKGSFPSRRLQHLEVRFSGQSAAATMNRVFLLPQPGARLVSLDGPVGRTNIRCISCDFDGGMAAVGCSDGEVYTRRAGDPEWREQFQMQGGAVCGLSLSADGRHLAAGGRDGTVKAVRLGDPGDGEASGEPGIAGLAMDSEGESVVCLTTDRHAVWYTLTRDTPPVWTGVDYMDWTGAYDFVENPFSLVCGARDRVLCWTPLTRETMAMGKGHGGLVTAVRAVNDRIVVSAGKDNVLRCWDRYDGRLINWIDNTPAVCSVLGSLGPEGPVVAAMDEDAWIWEPTEIGEPHKVIRSDGMGRITAVASDPGHAVFALGYETGFVQVYSRQDHKKLAGYNISKWSVTCLRFDNRDMLYAVGADGHCAMWEIPGGKVWEFARGTRVVDIQRGPGAGRWTTQCFDGFLHVWVAWERTATWRIGPESMFRVTPDNRILVGTPGGALYTLALSYPETPAPNNNRARKPRNG
ncbi:MAG: TIR domain-containing protein [Desulfatibacillaceae bacterium]